jgi:pimeloyl-ACP methyl ester carboxylesterase
MPHRSERVRFLNQRGVDLAGIIEWPPGEAHRFAVFAHCFTCGKDLKAIVRIGRHLAALGTAVLRFDFTGLGDSRGDFSQTTFEHNQEDLLAAVDYLTREHRPPELLVGHSLGGAAVLACASRVPTATALVNIASPASTRHLADYLAQTNPAIEQLGAGEVEIGGRSHLIRREMLATLRQTDLGEVLRNLRLPLLIFFSPLDETLPWRHGREMFELAGGPTSFITLDGADHLLVNQPGDTEFVARMIDAWSRRFSDV